MDDRKMFKNYKKPLALMITLMFILSLFAVFPVQEAEAATYKTLPVRNFAAGETHEEVNQVTVTVDSDVLEARHAGRTFRLFMNFPGGFSSTVTAGNYENVAAVNGEAPYTSPNQRNHTFNVTVGGAEVEVPDDAPMVNIEIDNLGGVAGLSIVDVTVHDAANIAGAAQFSADESPNAAIGERLTISTFEDTFDLYVKDAAGEVLETAEVDVPAEGDPFSEWIPVGDAATVVTPFDPTEDLKFTINFDSLTIPVGYSGDINASFSSAPETVDGLTPVLGTIFDDKAVTIAKVGVGEVTVSMSGVNFITDSNVENDIARVRFTEDVAGAMAAGNTIRLQLPRGFYWDSNLDGATLAVNIRYGERVSGNTDALVDVTLRDAADLIRTKYRTLQVSAPRYADGTSALAGDKRTQWEISGRQIRIIVDPRTAETGAVDASLSGQGVDVAPSDLIVASYGEYVATAEALTSPTRMAGKMNQALGSFEIREDVASSLIQNRSITLTLPEGTKWIPGELIADIPDEWWAGLPWFGDWWRDYIYEVARGNAPRFDEDASSRRGFTYGIDGADSRWLIVDEERRTIRTTVQNASDPGSRAGALLIFDRGGRVAIEPTFRGDIEVEVGGTAGAAGDIVIGTVVAPAVAEVVGDAAKIMAGYPSQALPDVEITETRDGALTRDDVETGIISLSIPLPRGASFSHTPSAEVTEGDMVIERVWMSADKTAVNVQVVASSDEASTVRVSDMAVTLDRAVPYGDFSLHLGGDAVIDNPIPTRMYFLDSDVMQEVKVAEVVDEITPTQVVMWVGQTTYTVNGEAAEMDVAPFIEDDRTFVPVRFVGEEFGAEADWTPKEGLTEVVTLTKGDMIVTINIGDPVITIMENGVPRTVTADVAAQIVNDRTYLPLRAIGEIFGATFDWGPKEAMTQWVSFTK